MFPNILTVYTSQVRDWFIPQERKKKEEKKKIEETPLHRKNWEGNFPGAEENLGLYSHWFLKVKPIKQLHSKSLQFLLWKTQILVRI